MANEKDRREVSEFTLAFSAALRAVMGVRKVTQSAVAKAIGRDQSFVSERTSGKRPVDTDIIAGIAIVADVEPRKIVAETLRKMQDPDGGTVVQFPGPSTPPTPAAARRDRVAKTVPKAARNDPKKGD